MNRTTSMLHVLVIRSYSLNRTHAPLYTSVCSQQPATCPYPNSCPCIFFIRSVLIVHLCLGFPSDSFSCMHVLLNVCAITDLFKKYRASTCCNMVWQPVSPYWHPNWKKLAGWLNVLWPTLHIPGTCYVVATQPHLAHHMQCNPCGPEHITHKTGSAGQICTLSLVLAAKQAHKNPELFYTFFLKRKPSCVVELKAIIYIYIYVTQPLLQQNAHFYY
jgi:hypothetical protein